MNSWANRKKLAEVTSGVGAGVIGVGLGAVLAPYLMRYWVTILILGIVLHSWGMYNRHTLEKSETKMPTRWETTAYWVCWIFLVALIVFIGSQV